MTTAYTTPESIEILTCGHSNRTATDLIKLLSCHRVEQLVDVRANPRSRRHPHFNRDTLEAALGEAGIDYVWAGDGLGGFRKVRADSANTALIEPGFQAFADYMATRAFRNSIESLLELARAGSVAIMCAEADHRTCHRQFIADALNLRKVRVKHIPDAERTLVHELNPCLGDERDPPVYNRNEQGDLFT